MKKKQLLLTTLAMLLFVLFYQSCSENKPDCTTCPEEQISDYNFYILNLAFQHRGVYVYNTKLKELTDFYSLPDPITGFAISGDGSKLLVTTSISFEANNLIIYNIPEMDTFKIVPLEQDIHVSNTGAYIAILDDSLTFLDGATFEILFIDTVETSYGRFLSDDSKYYTQAAGNFNEIRIYDMPGESLLTTYDFIDKDSGNSVPWLIQPTDDEEKIYMKVIHGGSIFRQYLVSFYPANDSIGIRYKLGGGMGDITLTPDGKQIIVTDPWNHLGYPGSSNILFLDTKTDRFISIVPGLFSIPGSEVTYIDPNACAVTPDSKYALFTPGGSHRGVVALLDLEFHRFVDFEILSMDSTAFAQVECQKLMK